MRKEDSIQEFDFMNHYVEAVWNETLGWLFSPRRFCENIGLNWPGQQKKIRDDTEKFSCMDIHTTGKDGKQYKMLMIPANRIDTWLLSINANKIKDKLKKKVLVDYQSKLSDWLHTRHFLTTEEEQIITDVAYGREQLHFEKMKNMVLGLPDELSGYKQDRLRLITDVALGIKPKSLLGEYISIDKDSFYKHWSIDGWDPDVFIVAFPRDFHTPQDVYDYAQKLGLKSREIYVTDIPPSLARIMTKDHRLGHSISSLVLKYNHSGANIRKAIYYTVQYLVHEFMAYGKGAPPLPDNITAETLSQRLNEYRRNPKYCWYPKRNAFYSVYDCCEDCYRRSEGVIGYEIVSKHWQAHHRHYISVGQEHPSDLVPLCKVCHEEREFNR